ncbi:MAG: phage tail protein [Sphingomonas sp.]
MGKVLKTVAIIAVAVAIAYFAPQISALILGPGASAAASAAVTAAVSTALSIGAGLVFQALAGKPSTTTTPQTFRQAIANSFIVYGKRRVGGLLIFFHPVGKSYRYFVIAVAGHRCKGVVRWWLGDEQVTVDGSGKVTSGTYANNAWLWFYRGTDDQVAHPTFVAETSGKWTANHRCRGTALIYAKFNMSKDVVQAGMPNITAEIEGKDDIYDPRTDAEGYTRNAALVFNDWMALPREEGGFGAYADELDDDWIAAQANICDEDVPLKAGGTEKRYCFDSYITTGAAPSEVRDGFVTCCAGTYTYSGGKHLMRPGYYVPVSATLEEADLAAGFTVNALTPGDQIADQVTGTYVNPGDLYQPADVPTRSVAADSATQANYDLPHVTSITQGQRVLEILLRKAQAERKVTWPMNIMGIAISAMDTVRCNTAKYGLSNYAFQVASWGLATDFSVSLTLEETNPDIFYWDSSMELAPGERGTIDKAEPIGDDDASLLASLINQSKPSTDIVITADLDETGEAATVSIGAHSRIYSDKVVAVGAGSITGLELETYYVIFYDDPDRAGGAVTYQASTDPDDAMLTADHPGRHYLGNITTPAEGETGGTTGGGASGPGGLDPCVTVDSEILMANASLNGPGEWKAADDVVLGERVWTIPEHELGKAEPRWGAYPVDCINKARATVMRADGHADATPGHRWWHGGWVKMREIGTRIGQAMVWKATVRGANTYVARRAGDAGDGIVSHNLKQRDVGA